MKINGNALKVGNVVEHLGKLWVVAKTEHVKPGKGGAFMQAELKGLMDGTKKNERFRASEQVERVHLDEKTHQYLYEDGEDIVLMDQDSFEQINVSKSLVGEPAQFLQDGMNVKVCLYEGAPVSVQLPDTVIMEITEADAVVKGQTASSSYKPAVLENGARVMVPPHIGSGTRIVVNTEDGSYVERAKN